MHEFRRNMANAILQLLRDEALASGTDCPQAFGFLIPREADMDTTLKQCETEKAGEPVSGRTENAGELISGRTEDAGELISGGTEDAGELISGGMKKSGMFSCETKSSAAAPCESGFSLYAKSPFLYYEPERLLQEFCDNTGELLARYRAVCLDAWNAESAKSKLRTGGAAGSGRSGRPEDETAMPGRRDRIDYRRFLQRFCIPREETVTDLDSFDYIPYLYGLSHYEDLTPAKPCAGARFPEAGGLPHRERLMLVEPLEYSEVNRLDELAIAIDTSASCREAQVRRFLEETWSLLRQRENFFSHMRLHLIQCDSMIEDYRVFTDVREWEEALPKFRIYGRGSTDFRPVFDLLTEKLRTREIRSLRALLYFTDGDGVYPREKPPFDTAFVFLNRESEKGTPPDWVIRLNLSEEAASR